MRKQLLIPVASDEILQAPWDDGDPSDPGDQSSGWGEGAVTKEAPTIR
jgi:hypothetical protein